MSARLQLERLYRIALTVATEELTAASLADFSAMPPQSVVDELADGLRDALLHIGVPASLSEFRDDEIEGQLRCVVRGALGEVRAN